MVDSTVDGTARPNGASRRHNVTFFAFRAEELDVVVDMRPQRRVPAHEESRLRRYGCFRGRPGGLSALAAPHGYPNYRQDWPPAIAGRITSVSPSPTGVWRPSSTRT